MLPQMWRFAYAERMLFPMKTLGLLALLALALSGCAMTYDVVKVGPETYQVSAVAAPARGGVAGAQHRAIEAANDKCGSLHKDTSVTGVETGHDFPAAGRAVVTFTCT